MENNNTALLNSARICQARISAEGLTRNGGKLTTDKQRKMGASHDDDDDEEDEDNLYVVDGAVTDIVRCMYIMPLLLGGLGLEICLQELGHWLHAY